MARFPINFSTAGRVLLCDGDYRVRYTGNHLWPMGGLMGGLPGEP